MLKVLHQSLNTLENLNQDTYEISKLDTKLLKQLLLALPWELDKHLIQTRIR